MISLDQYRLSIGKFSLISSNFKNIKQNNKANFKQNLCFGRGHHILFKFLLIYLSVINLIEFDYIASKNNNKINHILNGNIGNSK